ncbi:MAG: hypothetical protein JWP27_2737 [Flaviaesturariibacter sp.]|nr:hypothetical protein [Flaviaesturariibacter sp.]
MPLLNRKILIDTLVRHETLTVDDLAKPVNLGFAPHPGELTYLLHRLQEAGFITALAGVDPRTFTITDKGIAEGQRLATAST